MSLLATFIGGPLDLTRRMLSDGEAGPRYEVAIVERLSALSIDDEAFVHYQTGLYYRVVGYVEGVQHMVYLYEGLKNKLMP